MKEHIMNKRWIIHPPDPHQQVAISNALKVHPIVAQLLINRNIIDLDEAAHFLKPAPSHLHDPFLMKDMDKAVARVKQAQSRGERVLIFGDYDVDGVTSSAVLRHAFETMGIDVINYIPHRIDEGYGLNTDIAVLAKEQNVSLIMTVDCGITCYDEVVTIQAAGIDVIVLDHHTPDDERLPPALAVIDPKRKDCPYPFKHMAAVGLAAKFAHALTGNFPVENLDLIAVGTIADVVPLRGENRVFTFFGLPKIGKTKKPGLQALLEVGKVANKPMKPHYVGFVLGPRINAAGRMDSATMALDLLMSDNLEEARALAQALDNHNQDRQKMQRDVVQEAIALAEESFHEDDQVVVLYKEGWHKGVVGIVASRIVEKFNRPSIVISGDDGVGVGSARSHNGFHLYNALAHCAEHLETFGGHKMAAGLKVRQEKVAEFKMAINDFARTVVTSEEMAPTIAIDMDIPINQLSIDLAHIINGLQPFGEANIEPILCSRQLTIKSRPQVLGRNTLKMWLTDGQVSVSAVGFGMGDLAAEMAVGDQVDVAYHLSIDDWNKAPTVQLTLKDVIIH